METSPSSCFTAWEKWSVNRITLRLTLFLNGCFCIICCYSIRNPNTLRFPGAAGEPPRADALRGLTDAFAPPGVYVYSGC